MIEVGSFHPDSDGDKIEYVDVEGVRVGIVAEEWAGGDMFLVSQDWEFHGPHGDKSEETYVFEQLYHRALEVIALHAQGYEPYTIEDGTTVVWGRDG